MSNGSSESDDDSDQVLSPIKTRRRRELLKPDHTSEDDKTVKNQKKITGKKRRRVEIESEEDDSSSEDVSESDSDNSSTEEDFVSKKKKTVKKPVKKKSKRVTKKGNGNKKKTKKSTKGRRKIVKIISEDELDEETKAAEENERQRLQRLKEKVESSQDDVDVMESTTEEDFVLQKDPFVKVAPQIAKHLKVHQIEGVKFMWNNLIEDTELANKDSRGNGCILAHCMGLGKTLQSITIVHTILNCAHLDINTVLVVCPLNTVRNWLAEIDMWTANHRKPIKTYSLCDARRAKERYEEFRKWKKTGGMMVIGYDMMRRLSTGQNIKHKPWRVGLQECLVDPGPDMVICDEGHMLKNANANISMEMRKIRTRRRIVLTGTPLQNNLVEYHCMVEFVKPGLLGTLPEFRNRFMNPILNGQHTDSTKHDVFLMKKRAHVLHDMLKGFVQRQDYSVLAPYLKPKFEYVVKCRLSLLQIKLYQHYLDTNTNRGCNAQIVNTYGKGVSLFADYQNLMRVWTHPKGLFLHTDKVKVETERKRVREMLNNDIDEEEARSTSEEEEEFGVNLACTINKIKSSKKSSTRNGVENVNVNANLTGDTDKRTNCERDKTQMARTRQEDEEEDATSSNADSDDDSNSPPARSSKKRNQRVSSESESEESSSSSSSESESDSNASASEKKQRLTRSQRLRRRKNQLNDDEDDQQSEEKPVIIEPPKQWYEAVMPDDNKDLEILEHSPKIIILFEIIKRAEACGDKVLVFSQSLLSLDIIEEFLAMCCDLGPEDRSSFLSKHRPGNGQWFRNIDYFRMDGSIDGQRRQKWINDFNNTDDTRARLFLISTRAGSLGVNLVAANRVVIFDASWNPTHDTQSMFRVYRFGQTKPCYIYRLIAEGTMEEKIYERQVTKQSLAFRVVDEQQINRYFTANSLAEMYKFKPTLLEDEKDKPMPIVPKDYILADLLSESPTKDQIVSYHEHDTLLDHQEHEELTEEERKAAWDEFHHEKERKQATYAQPPPRVNPSQIFNINLNNLPTSIADLDRNINLAAKLINEAHAQLKRIKIQTREQITAGLERLMPNADVSQFESAVETIYHQQLQHPLLLQDKIRKLVSAKSELMLERHKRTQALMQESVNNQTQQTLTNSLFQSILKMQHNAMVRNIDAPSTSQQTTTTLSTETKLEVIDPKMLTEETKKLANETPTPVPKENPVKAKRTIYDIFNVKREPKVVLKKLDIIEIESSQELE